MLNFQNQSLDDIYLVFLKRYEIGIYNIKDLNQYFHDLKYYCNFFGILHILNQKPLFICELNNLTSGNFFADIWGP